MDVLRGLAVLGILIMNIQSFALPSSAYINPTSFEAEKLVSYNLWVWLVSHIFADGKFMAIFSMLFGALLLVSVVVLVLLCCLRLVELQPALV